MLRECQAHLVEPKSSVLLPVRLQGLLSELDE